MWPGVHAKKLYILDATIVLEVPMVDEYECDEKAMFAVEEDPENDEDEGATNGSTTEFASAAARIK